MKFNAILLLAAMLLLPVANSYAQFRSDAGSSLDRTGNIIRSQDPDERNSLFGLQDFQMGHSYEMSVGSFGGNMYNQNIYTNTMQMRFNENLHGRVDLSMSHSPFGPNIMGQEGQPQFFVRNAELNYKVRDNARIQLRFQQLPAGHGFGYYSPHYHRSRMNHHPYGW